MILYATGRLSSCERNLCLGVMDNGSSEKGGKGRRHEGSTNLLDLDGERQPKRRNISHTSKKAIGLDEDQMCKGEESCLDKKGGENRKEKDNEDEGKKKKTNVGEGKKKETHCARQKRKKIIKGGEAKV